MILTGSLQEKHLRPFSTSPYRSERSVFSCVYIMHYQTLISSWVVSSCLFRSIFSLPGSSLRLLMVCCFAFSMTVSCLRRFDFIISWVRDFDVEPISNIVYEE